MPSLMTPPSSASFSSSFRAIAGLSTRACVVIHPKKVTGKNPVLGLIEIRHQMFSDALVNRVEIFDVKRWKRFYTRSEVCWTERL